LGAFRLTPAAFVATATATGLLVDAARTPVYLWNGARELLPHWTLIGTAAVGVLVGTLMGERLLLGMPVRHFGQIVGAAVGLLGIWLLLGAP
jgi:uncharacterized membrane protein YfcA